MDDDGASIGRGGYLSYCSSKLLDNLDGWDDSFRGIAYDQFYYL